VLHTRSEGFENIPSSERPLHLVINITSESPLRARRRGELETRRKPISAIISYDGRAEISERCYVFLMTSLCETRLSSLSEQQIRTQSAICLAHPFNLCFSEA